ncbi:GyrI-like domain-containing protein [Gynurincola endophyticus]|jgi:predicted transcriptional regulator YdeE|uniref:GyrI-like domain-containing protein n=1 Tax=Gynurincola endophyticus TaxID=2479004 RepID=UPI000F8EFD66|nr:GyrI-like domain-containing protein [Gynurincola endophyticus]
MMEIVQLPATTVAVIPVSCGFEELSVLVPPVFQKLSAPDYLSGLKKNPLELICITKDIQEGIFNEGVGFLLNDSATLPVDMELWTIPAGRFVKYRHEGLDTPASFHKIFVWMKQHQLEFTPDHNDHPHFEIYDLTSHQADYFVFDIYVRILEVTG